MIKNLLNNLSNIRIDRDVKRMDLYDRVEYIYNLNSNKKDLYDLSNNPIKYNIINELINPVGDNYFARKNSLFNSNNNFIYYNTNNLTHQGISLQLEDILRLDNDSDFESYGKKYDSSYNLDGQLLFKDSIYQNIKNILPNESSITINKEIN